MNFTQDGPRAMPDPFKARLDVDLRGQQQCSRAGAGGALNTFYAAD